MSPDTPTSTVTRAEPHASRMVTVHLTLGEARQIARCCDRMGLDLAAHFRAALAASDSASPETCPLCNEPITGEVVTMNDGAADYRSCVPCAKAAFEAGQAVAIAGGGR